MEFRFFKPYPFGRFPSGFGCLDGFVLGLLCFSWEGEMEFFGGMWIFGGSNQIQALKLYTNLEKCGWFCVLFVACFSEFLSGFSFVWKEFPSGCCCVFSFESEMEYRET